MTDKDVEVFRQRKKVLADMRRIVEAVGTNARHIILLDDYEVVNLREAFYATGYAHADSRSPLEVLQTGDWLGQIWTKLPHIEGAKPNKSATELIRLARAWRSND